MSTQIDIVNMALTYIAQQTISSIEDDSDNAIKSKVLWDNCRDFVLRSAPWSFTTVIQELVEYSDESVTGWNYVYAYPTKCLNLRSVFQEWGNNFYDTPVSGFSVPNTVPLDDYRVMFSPTLNLKIIVSNISPAFCEYTYQVSDPSVWDAQFVKAMSYKLASELANILCGDKDESKRMFEHFQLAISDAKMYTQNEGKVKPIRKSDYIDAR